MESIYSLKSIIVLIIFAVPILTFTSCEVNEKTLNVTFVDKEKLVDDQPQLGELFNVSFNKKKHFVTYDNQNNIKEFENYEFIKLIGQSGNGQCEYGSLNNLLFNGDQIKLLDRENSKYIVYDNNSEYHECSEVVLDYIPNLMSLEELNGNIFFLRGTLQQGTNIDTNLIYKLSDNHNSSITPLDITLSDIDVKLPKFPIRLSLASTIINNKIAFYYPFNKKVILYNPLNEEISYLDIDIYVGEDKDIHNEEEMMVVMDYINNKIEVVFDIFSIDNDKLAIVYRKGIELDNQYWGLQIYSIDGTKIGQHRFEERIIHVSNDYAYGLELEPNNFQEPYAITKYAYE